MCGVFLWLIMNFWVIFFHLAILQRLSDELVAVQECSAIQ